MSGSRGRWEARGGGEEISAPEGAPETHLQDGHPTQ